MAQPGNPEYNDLPPGAEVVGYSDLPPGAEVVPANQGPTREGIASGAERPVVPKPMHTTQELIVQDMARKHQIDTDAVNRMITAGVATVPGFIDTRQGVAGNLWNLAKSAYTAGNPFISTYQQSKEMGNAMNQGAPAMDVLRGQYAETFNVHPSQWLQRARENDIAGGVGQMGGELLPWLAAAAGLRGPKVLTAEERAAALSSGAKIPYNSAKRLIDALPETGVTEQHFPVPTMLGGTADVRAGLDTARGLGKRIVQIQEAKMAPYHQAVAAEPILPAELQQYPELAQYLSDSLPSGKTPTMADVLQAKYDANQIPGMTRVTTGPMQAQAQASANLKNWKRIGNQARNLYYDKASALTGTDLRPIGKLEQAAFQMDKKLQGVVDQADVGESTFQTNKPGLLKKAAQAYTTIRNPLEAAQAQIAGRGATSPAIEFNTTMRKAFSGVKPTTPVIPTVNVPTQPAPTPLLPQQASPSSPSIYPMPPGPPQPLLPGGTAPSAAPPASNAPWAQRIMGDLPPGVYTPPAPAQHPLLPAKTAPIPLGEGGGPTYSPPGPSTGAGKSPSMIWEEAAGRVTSKEFKARQAERLRQMLQDRDARLNREFGPAGKQPATRVEAQDASQYLRQAAEEAGVPFEKLFTLNEESRRAIQQRAIELDKAARR